MPLEALVELNVVFVRAAQYERIDMPELISNVVVATLALAHVAPEWTQALYAALPAERQREEAALARDIVRAYPIDLAAVRDD